MNPNDIMLSTLFVIDPPSGVPEEITKRHSELRQRVQKLDKLQTALDAEQNLIHLADDPFAAAADYRDRVLSSWRAEASLWRAVVEFARELCDEIREMRIKAVGERLAAEDQAKRDYYAIHTEVAPDYAVAEDERVIDSSFKEASVKRCENAWLPVLGQGEREAVACDQRVREAIDEALRPILSPVT